jgi:hypothetical protein
MTIAAHNPGGAAHVVVLAAVVVIGLAVWAVVRWRNRGSRDG